MKFEFNQPFTTDKTTVEVDALPVGRYHFVLVVVNQAGRPSLPFDHVVTVLPLPDPIPPP